MSCEEIRNRLEDWLDDELSAAERAEIDRHLGECLACRRELRSLQSLADATSRLPRGIDPGRDLWSGIESRIGGAPRRAAVGRGAWWAVAAALVVLVGLPLVLRLERRWNPAPAGEVQVVAPLAERGVNGSGLSEREVVLEAGLARSEDGTQHLRNDLEVGVELRRDVWSDEVVDDMEENLRILDVAVAELRRAIDEDPWNRRLSHLLAARYQQEAELAQRMRRI